MKYTLFFFLVILLLSACSFGEKEKQTEVVLPEAVRMFVDYEIKTIDVSIGPCVSDSTSQKCLIFQVEYPLITGGPAQEVLDQLNENIKSDITNTYTISEKPISFEELQNNLSTDYQKMLDEFPEYSNAWALEINSDILYQDSLFISVATTIYSYTGGAHPNSVQVYRSYDLRTGKPITLDQILIPGYERELNAAGEIEFRMTKEIPPDITLKERGYWFEEGQFSLNQNFAIINKSLVFYFNPYEIAPYSMGPTELELKLTDYAQLIKEGSVIYAYKN